MTENEGGFRAQVWFRKAEYGDVFAALKGCKTSEEESGRVRYLIRLGLQAERGAAFPPPGTIAPAASPVLPSSAPKAESPEPVKATDEGGPSFADKLDAYAAGGFDITQFNGLGKAA